MLKSRPLIPFPATLRTARKCLTPFSYAWLSHINITNRLLHKYNLLSVLYVTQSTPLCLIVLEIEGERTNPKKLIDQFVSDAYTDLEIRTGYTLQSVNSSNPVICQLGSPGICWWTLSTALNFKIFVNTYHTGTKGRGGMQEQKTNSWNSRNLNLGLALDADLRGPAFPFCE